MDKRIFIPIIQEDDGVGSRIWWISKYLDKNYGMDLRAIIQKFSPHLSRQVVLSLIHI